MSCIQAESSVPTAEEIVAALRTDPELCREVILTALMSDLSFRQEEEQRPMGNGRTGGSVGSIGPSEDVAVNRIYHLIADATDPVLESDAQIIAARAMVWAAIMSADGIGSELTVDGSFTSSQGRAAPCPSHIRMHRSPQTGDGQCCFGLPSRCSVSELCLNYVCWYCVQPHPNPALCRVEVGVGPR